MKFLFFLTFSFLCLNAWADGTVRFADPEEDIGSGTESVVRFNNGVGTSYIFANYEKPSGDGDSPGSAAESYIPLTNGGNQENRVSFAQSSLVPDTSTGIFQTLLTTVNDTGSDRKLYVAVQDPSDTTDYCIVGGGTTFSSSTSEVLSWVQASMAEVCASIDCSTLANPSTTKTKQFLFYYFFSATTYSTRTCESFSTSETGGAYLKGNFSVRLPSAALVINELRRGDGRLKALFTGATISDFNRTLALINGTGATVTAAGDTGTQLNVSGTELIDLEIASTASEANIKPLVNNVLYSVGLVIEDKYQLTTVISNVPASVAPAEIEALLEKQACYILSAGFGEKHFITDYFRGLRDKVLLKTSLGSAFVAWYYKTAPYYTATIYNSPAISFMVRCLAYIAWFVLNLILIAIPIVLITFIFQKFSTKSI